MISFSTCWNSGRHTAGDAMLREIEGKLGFNLIELGHGIRISLMPGIQKMFDAGKVRSPEERERAIKQTFQTIDFAKRLNAPFVVLHLGEVKMRPVTNLLIDLAKTGKYLSRKYVRLKVKAVQKRERIASDYLHRAKDCLRRIIDYSTTKNIKLGLEGRRGYEEIPTERELPALLEEMESPQLGYWHDFGHAQIKENLAFLDHAEWLRAIGPRTFGCHVQDCIWPAQDHQPPFAGDVDLEKLVPLLPANCLFVWEMSPNKTADEIRRSVQVWKERFGE
ncbi:MAG: hypothetical protein DME69_07425 [Verrucomicrobia bacterium]|nr:MAG: hypothetical protein DME69_07425 [Verrucomicrobiota bacterium]